jgi:hypothetical protein
MLRGCKVNQRAAALLAVCLASGPVHAGTCSNPAGNEADIKYNGDYHVLQFCNGTSWVNAGFIASPDTIAAAGQFGDTNVEATADNGDKNTLWSQQATLSPAGVVQSMSVYVSTAAGHLILGIYDATGPSGGPGALQATTAAFTPTTGWNTASVVTPVTLAAGSYWLAWITDSNTLTLQAESTTGTQKFKAQTYGAMPGTFSTTPSTTTWNDSLYASMTGCGSPTGNEGGWLYNNAYHTYQFCNGANWIQMEWVNGGGGGGGCSNPSGKEAALIYNGDYHTWQFCNGTNWVPFGGPAWITPPGAGNGYFVMSKTKWNGNLGGSLAAADALCLTELTTNTGWKGYAGANANGQLISSKVHAFICDHEGVGTCNNTVANTTYFFADANASTHGGNRFTTDSSGVGPNDNANWSGASYFGDAYGYWSDRQFGSATAWGTGLQTTGEACGAGDQWSNGTNAYTGFVANTDNTGTARWGGGTTPTCNNTENLICFVNP